MTYWRAILLTFKERSPFDKFLAIAGTLALPVWPFALWFFSLPLELQLLGWCLLVVLTAWLFAGAGKAAWEKVQVTLEQEQRYKTQLGVDLEELAQRLYKRVTEWWVASLAGDRQTAEQKRAAAEHVMAQINEKLRADVSEADAGYFRRPKPYEPYRPTMERLPDGNWINEMWHRVHRLEEIIQRLRLGPAAPRWRTRDATRTSLEVLGTSPEAWPLACAIGRLGRPASESGRLRHTDGAPARGDRRRRGARVG